MRKQHRLQHRLLHLQPWAYILFMVLGHVRDAADEQAAQAAEHASVLHGLQLTPWVFIILGYVRAAPDEQAAQAAYKRQEHSECDYSVQPSLFRDLQTSVAGHSDLNVLLL